MKLHEVKLVFYRFETPTSFFFVSHRDNVLKLNIFFEELNYEVISEEPSYKVLNIFYKYLGI